MLSQSKHILKFGGTSLQNINYIQQSAQIVSDHLQRAQPFVVVSALDGVTDKLIKLTRHLGDDAENIDQEVHSLRDHHLEIYDQLAKEENQQRSNLAALFDELYEVLSESSRLSISIHAQKDQILSVGERASAIIFAAALSNHGVSAHPFEAHQFIKTDSSFGKAIVKADASRKLIRQFLIQQHQVVPVVTGFIGSDPQKRITTLGRSGSDYTAGLIANALNADRLEIWTDVNGVLSADPEWVPSAESISHLSFADIAELSAHGANVIHPKTIRPIKQQDIRVQVKNSLNPSHSGTTITSDYKTNGNLKTITTTGPYVNLQVEQQYGAPLLTQLNRWSEEQNQSAPIPYQQSSKFEASQFLLEQSFFEQISDELGAWAAERDIILNLEADLYQIKKFSNHFTDDGSLSQRIHNLLETNNLKPVNTSQHQGKRFISFLYQKDEARLAARLINDYLRPNTKVVDLFIAGTGEIGKKLLTQLEEFHSDDIIFRLRGICNSREALWSDDGLSLESNPDQLDGQKTDWGELTNKLTQPHLHNLIFVDATGSKQVARLYPELLENNVHIVTPSKLANTFEQSFFDELQSLTNKHHSSLRYETTVGAGLPVISTIKNLLATGDKITEISGVVSGTMTYLFNELNRGTKFSEAVIKAREQGYAEPDPRDDLSGEDVARKFLTMARTLGIDIERDELEVESLIPTALRNVERSTFLHRLHEYDQRWSQKVQQAEQQDQSLCYTGTLKDGEVSIGLQQVDSDSPFGQLKGTDNLVQISTKRYNETPLIIQGPGAGKEVTAAGVLSDILKTAEQLV